MALVDTPAYISDEQDQAQGQAPTQPSTGGGNSTPDSTPSAPTATAAGQNPSLNVSPGSAPMAPSVQHARKATTGFTNLRQYIGANQNNNLGEKIAGTAQQKVDDSKQAIQKSYQDYQTQLNDEQAKYQGTQEGAQQALQYVDSGVKPQGSYTNDQAATALTGLKNYIYGGPQQINNLQSITQKQAELNDIAKNTATGSGRGALLQNQFGHSGQYSSGARNLDNFLLSNDHNALDQLRHVRSDVGQLNDQLQTTTAEATAQKAALQTQQAQDQAAQQSKMVALRDAIKGRLQTQADQYNAAQTADAGTLTDAEFKAALADAGYGNTVGYDPTTGELNHSVVPGAPQYLGLSPYVNLLDNTKLSSDQMFNPNKVYGIDYGSPGATPFSSADNEHIDSHRAQDILSPIVLKQEALRSLFGQKYDAPTAWTGVDADALARRNVLSQVLEDQGADTATAKSTVTNTVDNAKLDQLKDLNRVAQDDYARSFLSRSSNAQTAVDLRLHPEHYGLTRAQANKILDNDSPSDTWGAVDAGLSHNTSAVAKLAQKQALDNYLKQLGFNRDDYNFTYDTKDYGK